MLDGEGVRYHCTLDGGHVDLGTRAVLWTLLLVQELATNAMKYGALLVQQGRVEIGWRLAEMATTASFGLNGTTTVNLRQRR